MCKDTQKVTQNPLLHILHHVRLYSSIKAICGLSYACFIANWILRQLRETVLEYPKIILKETQNVIQSLQLNISHQMRLYSSVKDL